MCKRVVIKLGSAVLIKPDGSIASDRLFELVHVCSKLRARQTEVLIVSSGAVGLGRTELNLIPPLSILDKQAAAAVGQSLLMETYRKLFAAVSIPCAQVLLTHQDFADRKRYLVLQKVLNRLLELGTIPIINENDTVSAAELLENGCSKSFGDNDKLSALVASKLGCTKLVMLSNVDGVYSDNPQLNPGAQLIPEIEDFSVLTSITTDGHSAAGRGGMQSKLEAARIASLSGVETIIASGIQAGVMENLFFGNQACGTRIKAVSTMAERKHWIGMAAGTSGNVIINQGAAQALISRNASLLPVGISSIQGNFNARQTVSIMNEEFLELGRGIVNYSALELNTLIGKKTEKEAIVRENMVLFKELFT